MISEQKYSSVFGATTMGVIPPWESDAVHPWNMVPKEKKSDEAVLRQ